MSPIPPVAVVHPAASETRALADAGRQFEALIIRQMLASADPASGGPERDYRALAQQAMADQLARSGPLGVADLLARSARTSGPGTASGTAR